MILKPIPLRLTLFPYTTLFRSIVEPDLLEWNYGEYEGLTPRNIQEIRPGWLIFRDGCPGGETPDEVGRSEEHTSELQSQSNLVCRLLLEKKKAYAARKCQHHQS